MKRLTLAFALFGVALVIVTNNVAHMITDGPAAAATTTRKAPPLPKQKRGLIVLSPGGRTTRAADLDQGPANGYRPPA